MSKLTTTIRCIDLVRARSSEVLLFCSLGKDSLVLLDLLAPRFKRVVCIFMYFVDGLEHVEKYIKWAERRYPNIVFDRIPHWNLSYVHRGGLYCQPTTRQEEKLQKLRDVIDLMRAKHGIQDTFLGMKKSDSLNRRLMLNTYDQTTYDNKGLIYPLADWTQKEVLAYMKQKSIPLPIRYSEKASGGVGFNLDCFLWMRKNAPQDLAKVLEAYPLSERILWEYDNRNTKAQTTTDGSQ